MNATVSKNVNNWLNGPFDVDVKSEVKRLIADDPDELYESFYKNLEFGTAGLRGIMGVGTNRINKYTLAITTQGFANYLKKVTANELKVVIAYDCRKNSKFFAQTIAKIFAANEIKVFLFAAMRPTPELSFAIRHLNCVGGVMCTASHNPKEYNGYKAYWSDGAQLVPPHDEQILAEINNIASISEVKWTGKDHNITLLEKEIDLAYLDAIKQLSIYPDIIRKQHNLKIVYTPIHGTGIKLVPDVLGYFGFSNLNIVEEQAIPDGNFPTVIYPNPEEKEAMQLGLIKAQEINAEILLGTDPDADRIAVGLKNNKGEWILLNGNQTLVLAFAYIIEARRSKNLLKSNDMVVSTIVSTDMVRAVAEQNNVKFYRVLTGFKWIAKLIKEKETKENFLVGGEESFGLMMSDSVRDKDGISAVALLCEMAAVEKEKGNTLFDKLIDLYITYGFYLESLVSITKQGSAGGQEIANMMEGYRNHPPSVLAGIKVEQLLDYGLQQGKNLITGKTWQIKLPKSNVLQFVLEDGSKVSARPSGTEPKIKFYFSVNTKLDSRADFEKKKLALEMKLELLTEAMDLK